MSAEIKIIECPRDAMQGLDNFIPTIHKINYINQLLKVGFDTIDFGSFVSPKLIPQLKDTSIVLDSLDMSSTKSKLLSIVANFKGANIACNYEQIQYLGFPLSISEEFQQRNTNKSIKLALNEIDKIQELVIKNNKDLVVYLSMAFGNPYNEIYDIDLVSELTYKLNKMHIKIISLADTIGVSDNKNISLIFKNLINEFTDVEFGAHFHSLKEECNTKIDIAFKNGCRRFDSAINGYGGCPLASNKLVGNIPTENLISYFRNNLNIDNNEFSKSQFLAENIF